MRLFDIFKNIDKQASSTQTSLKTQKDAMVNFNCYYIYGLTDNPFRQSYDFESFRKLYKKVIGVKGGIVISSSFHPYQLVNPKGTTVWQAAYVELYSNDKKDAVFNAIINDNRLFFADPSLTFQDIMVWPDTRLTNDENPVFSKFVPFVIPFLVYNPTEELNWDNEIALGIKTNGNASDYVEQITQMTRFLLPEPSFVLGFDEFDEKNPSKLIDNFINCKLLIRQ